jgi:DNA-binding PadR family transcriptional regulator
MSSHPPPEALRQWLLGALTESYEAMTTAELRRCLSTVFGYDVVHERIYQNLEVLEKRGEVARTTPRGRHTLWGLARPHPRRLGS